MALYRELGCCIRRVSFSASRRQPAPKKRPSPSQSISGWAFNIFCSQVVPDFFCPITKKTGVAGGGRGEWMSSSHAGELSTESGDLTVLVRELLCGFGLTGLYAESSFQHAF